MQRSTRNPMTENLMLCATNPHSLSRQPRPGYVKNLWILMLAGTILLSACGGSSSGGSKQNGSLAGNWQVVSMANTSDLTASSGLQGGFLLQNNGAVTGSMFYSNTLQSSQESGPCNSGSAAITGTVSGQTVTLAVDAGGQTYTLTGTLGANGSLSGTYTAAPGPTVSVNGTPTACGEGTASGTPLAFTAQSVPPLTGSITGSFHSGSNQDFPVTGTFTQGENIGASNATVTGTLSFIDPITLISDYPCFSTASVNGQISGNSVLLQIIGTSGVSIGQIGGATGSGVNPVTFNSVATNQYILQSANGVAYEVSSPNCQGSSDTGTICLALNSTSACQEPITLSPALLTFAPQALGSTATTQTITLTNTDPSGAALNGLQLQLQLLTDISFPGSSDFNGLPNFTETDNCASAQGQSFSLNAQQSCTITISFAPQQSCPWLPGTPASVQAASPSYCPFPLGANLIVGSPASADGDKTFSLPISGTGLSFVQASIPELDFSAEALGETSLPQTVTLTNTSASPVQILPFVACSNGVGITPPFQLPHPAVPGSAAGLQVVTNIAPASNNVDTVTYNCDIDPVSLGGSGKPNFQISADSCTGTNLPAQAACTFEITYVPQPYSLSLFGLGLDFFLELNTLQCTTSQTSDCEIDSGRFPVELKANAPSPLRMLPNAGLNFGNQSVGHATASQTITLLNDPAANTTVDFVGKVQVSGNYTETDDCPFTLAPGSQCTLTVTFKPKAVGYDPGTLTIQYTQVSSSGSQTPGNSQLVQLHGTGQ